MEPAANLSGNPLLDTGSETVGKVRVAALGNDVNVPMSHRVELENLIAIYCHRFKRHAWVQV